MANRVRCGDSGPPVTYLSFELMGLLTNPEQYRSALVGVWTLSVGKFTVVGTVPDGVASAEPCWAKTAAGVKSDKRSTTFFMVPPGNVGPNHAKLLKINNLPLAKVTSRK